LTVRINSRPKLLSAEKTLTVKLRSSPAIAADRRRLASRSRLSTCCTRDCRVTTDRKILVKPTIASISVTEIENESTTSSSRWAGEISSPSTLEP